MAAASSSSSDSDLLTKEFDRFRNLKDFKAFEKKFLNIIRLSAKPIILKLEGSIGIKKVLLVNEREIIDTPSSKVNQLSLLGNLNALIDLCNDTSK